MSAYKINLEENTYLCLSLLVGAFFGNEIWPDFDKGSPIILQSKDFEWVTGLPHCSCEQHGTEETQKARLWHSDKNQCLWLHI